MELLPDARRGTRQPLTLETTQGPERPGGALVFVFSEMKNQAVTVSGPGRYFSAEW